MTNTILGWTILVVATVAFAALKLTGQISWSWLWVILPPYMMPLLHLSLRCLTTMIRTFRSDPQTTCPTLVVQGGTGERI